VASIFPVSWSGNNNPWLAAEHSFYDLPALSLALADTPGAKAEYQHEQQNHVFPAETFIQVAG
jgi:hypothetical protein